LPPERPLQLGHLTAQLPLAMPLLLASKRLAAALEQLLAPAVEERLRDRVLAADLLHRTVAAQAGQHDLDLLLGCPSPVLALLAQPTLLSVERPMLSRPPDSPSGATRLRDCPALQVSYLSTPDRGAGQYRPLTAPQSGGHQHVSSSEALAEQQTSGISTRRRCVPPRTAKRERW